MKLSTWKNKILENSNELNRLVLKNDKPTIEIIKKAKDLNNKIFAWTMQSDKEDIKNIKLNEL